MMGPLGTVTVSNVFTWMIIMVVVSSLKMDVIAFSYSSSLSPTSSSLSPPHPLINERIVNDNDPPSSSLPSLLRTSTTATTTKQSNNAHTTTMHLISLPPIDRYIYISDRISHPRMLEMEGCYIR